MRAPYDEARRIGNVVRCAVASQKLCGRNIPSPVHITFLFQIDVTSFNAQKTQTFFLLS
jgi:hypothetical protein